MENIKQHDHRTTRRPDCVTEIRMGNTVLVVSGFFKKDTTSTAADKMARVLEAEAAATQDCRCSRRFLQEARHQVEP